MTQHPVEAGYNFVNLCESSTAHASLLKSLQPGFLFPSEFDNNVAVVIQPPSHFLYPKENFIQILIYFLVHGWPRGFLVLSVLFILCCSIEGNYPCFTRSVYFVLQYRGDYPCFTHSICVRVKRGTTLVLPALFILCCSIEGDYVLKKGDEVTYKTHLIPPKNEKVQAVHVEITHPAEGVKHETWDAEGMRT